MILKLPVNIKKEDVHLFDYMLKNEPSLPSVKEIKNTFVTHEGLVLKHFILDSNSGFNLSGRLDINFYFKYWRLVLEQFLVCKIGKSLKSSIYSNKKYSIVHSKWFNYSFWITDSLNRCIMLENNYNLDDFILLVPENIYNNNYVKESLSVFNFKVELISNGYHCFIKNLILPTTRKYSSSFHPETISNIQKKMIPLALERTNLTDFPSKIYISRKNRGVRALMNEMEVENCLIESGFEILNFDNLSFWDQIALMHNADCLLGVHGAGLANCIFMQKGSFLIELLEFDFAHYGNPFPYWKLACVSNLEYKYLLGFSDDTERINFVKNKKTDSKTRSKLVDRRFEIDIKQLKEVLNG